jgi:hypothetical protein
VLKFFGLFCLPEGVGGRGAASFRGDFSPGWWDEVLRRRGRHCCGVFWGGTGGQMERELQDGGCVYQGAGYWEGKH